MADFVEGIMGCTFEFLWLKINRVFEVVSGNFSSHIPLLAPQVLFRKIFVIISLGFLFKQTSTIIFLHRFSVLIKSFKSLFFQKENRAKCVQD